MRFILLLTFLATSFSVFAQDTSGNNGSHEHGKNEIGIAISPAYFIN